MDILEILGTFARGLLVEPKLRVECTCPHLQVLGLTIGAVIASATACAILSWETMLIENRTKSKIELRTKFAQGQVVVLAPGFNEVPGNFWHAWSSEYAGTLLAQHLIPIEPHIPVIADACDLRKSRAGTASPKRSALR
jgi:hypothetical protein